MNTAIKKRIRKTKDANVRDRLRLVGDVQEGMSITGAAKKLGMSQPWGSKWWAREMISNWHFEREILGTLSVEFLLLITSPLQGGGF